MCCERSYPCICVDRIFLFGNRLSELRTPVVTKRFSPTQLLNCDRLTFIFQHRLMPTALYYDGAIEVIIEPYKHMAFGSGFIVCVNAD